MPRKSPPRFPAVDAAIKKKGTVQHFLREADVKQPTYYAMQSGLSAPTLGLIYKVLDYTGLDFDQAFGRG
jgi:hypothetical protein